MFLQEMSYWQPNLSPVLLAQQAPNHALILRAGSSLMAVYLSLIIKMRHLQSPCVRSHYPVQNTHSVKIISQRPFEQMTGE